MQQSTTPNTFRRNRTKPRPLAGNYSGLWLVIVFVLMCELFVYTATRVDYTHKGFEMSKAKAARNRTIAYQKELIVEHDRLCSPDRISSIAESRLGLVRPQTDRVIYLDRPDTVPVVTRIQENSVTRERD